MPIVEQNGGGASGGDGLPLYYVHAANGNKGNGSVDNPFGNFDLLLAFLDANPTIVGATIIVLGGNYFVDKNIYRGCSFYFFPGVIIDVFMPTANDALLYDDGTRNGYSTDFFFSGDVTVNIRQGYFSKMGYHYSNSGRVAGKKFRFEFANLTSDTTGYLFELYGRINIYDITIKTVNAPSKSFILAKKSTFTPSGDESVFANSGTSVSLKINELTIIGIYEAHASLYSFIGRYSTFKIGTFNLSRGSFIYKGQLSIGRKCVVNLEIDTLVAFNELYPFPVAGLGYLFPNISTTTEEHSNPVLFIFKNTSFVYNTAVPSYCVERTNVVLFTDVSYVDVYVTGCTKPLDSPINAFFTQNSIGNQRLKKIGIFAVPEDAYVVDFDTINSSIYKSIINL